MKTIEIDLDDETLERARRTAETRGCSIEHLIEEMLRQMAKSETGSDPFLGMFADEPELLDEVVESAMRAREKHGLRQGGG